jgi:hypothetical protein
LNWRRGGATNFTSQLFSLFCKADADNRIKLSLGFPEEWMVFTEWYHSPAEDAFYEKYGVERTTELEKQR